MILANNHYFNMIAILHVWGHTHSFNLKYPFANLPKNRKFFSAEISFKKKKNGKICTQGKSKFNPKICTEKSGRPTMHMVKNLGIYKYAFIKQNG